MSVLELPASQKPPEYCQYVDEPCNQVFLPTPSRRRIFFAYSSDPPQIAESIEIAAAELRGIIPQTDWQTWRDVSNAGQIIYCEICKTMRTCQAMIADVTTLNFNLLFEIGFAIGLGLPVVLMRDSTYSIDREAFAALGLFDTIAQVEFQSSQDIVATIPNAVDNARPLSDIPVRLYRDAPGYVLRSGISTEGAIQLESTLNKSRIHFRTYDPSEIVRLTLNDARRQVNGSLAVFANLLSPNRDGARIHNGLCAFVGGYAVARQKIVMLLQEGTNNVQPSVQTKS